MSFSFPDEITAAEEKDNGEPPVPHAAAKQESPSVNEDRASPPAKERDDNWSLALSSPSANEPLSIPKESRPPLIDTSIEAIPKFEMDWHNPSSLLEKKEPSLALPLSTLPYLILFATFLLIYSMLTLVHQTQPKTMETFIKAVPLLGSLVFKNNHLRKAISIQSLRPGFQTILGNREVFVVSGMAINRNPVSVREVRVEGHLYNAEGKEIERQSMWVGNAISAKIIRGMTAQDISDLQKLKPLRRFEIPPEESVPFTIVFLKPTSTKIGDFSWRVLSAEGGA